MRYILWIILLNIAWVSVAKPKTPPPKPATEEIQTSNPFIAVSFDPNTKYEFGKNRAFRISLLSSSLALSTTAFAFAVSPLNNNSLDTGLLAANTLLLTLAPSAGRFATKRGVINGVATSALRMLPAFILSFCPQLITDGESPVIIVLPLVVWAGLSARDLLRIYVTYPDEVIARKRTALLLPNIHQGSYGATLALRF
jgi:hypothetical protein